KKISAESVSVHVRSGARGKFDLRALKCVFVGYSSTQKGYKCYHLPSKKFCLEMPLFFSYKVSFTLGPEIGTENETDYEKEVQPTKSIQDEDHVRFGKNLVYTRKTKTIPESAHVHESNPTLHEVTVFPNDVISSE
ncbi:hypothetical protein PHAVU_010G041100, partial [Phaseolus vulgaris]